HRDVGAASRAVDEAHVRRQGGSALLLDRERQEGRTGGQDLRGVFLVTQRVAFGGRREGEAQKAIEIAPGRRVAQDLVESLVALASVEVEQQVAERVGKRLPQLHAQARLREGEAFQEDGI